MTIAGPVLFVSDLRPTSDHALRRSADLARGAGVALVVCHVLPEVVGIRPLFPQLRVLDTETAEKLRTLAARALEDQLTRVLKPDEERPEIRLESGFTHAVVVEMAEELRVGLIVMGGDDREGGSAEPIVAPERVARHAGRPFLLSIAKPGCSVLAATDFSDPSLPAVRTGKLEAFRLGFPLYVMHSVELSISTLGLPEITSSTLISTVIEARREEAQLLLERLSTQMGGGLVLLRDGAAADAILDCAESINAALVVVGSHGRTGLTRLAFGSVAEEVLRRARRTTLVVPLTEEKA